MSGDYLAVKSHKEKLEDENFELQNELGKLKRDRQLKEALVGDAGLEFSKPEEIATRFITLREKHRRMIAENEELKSKLRLYEADIIQNDSKQSSTQREIRKYLLIQDKQNETIETLTRKIKDQQKLEGLCKEQEKIISKLEDLFFENKNKH